MSSLRKLFCLQDKRVTFYRKRKNGVKCNRKNCCTSWVFLSTYQFLPEKNLPIYIKAHMHIYIALNMHIRAQFFNRHFACNHAHTHQTTPTDPTFIPPDQTSFFWFWVSEISLLGKNRQPLCLTWLLKNNIIFHYFWLMTITITICSVFTFGMQKNILLFESRLFRLHTNTQTLKWFFLFLEIA